MSKPTVLKGATSATAFQTAIVQAPRYQYLVYSPQTQQNSVNTVSTGTTTVTFAPPANVYNWSRSFLSWTDTEEAATNAGATTTCKSIDSFPIQSIRLMTQSGKLLAEVNEFRSYSQTMRHLQTDYRKFQTSSLSDAQVVANLPAGTVNKPRALPYAAGSNTTINQPFRERLYTITSTPGGALTIKYRLCFGDAMAYTLLALQQDMYFRDPILLQVVFCNYDFVRWAIATGSTDPNNGPVIKASATAGRGSALTNVQLNMAVQQNEILENQTRVAMGANFRLSIPYLYSQTNLIAAANTQPTIQNTISSAFGQVLRWIFTTIYDGVENINTANDMSQEFSNAANRQKITSYQTLKDGRPIQPYVLVCANGDDYLFNRMYMEGTAVGLDPTTYNASWFHWDVFGDETAPGARFTPLAKEAIVGGIGLTAVAVQHHFKPILSGARDSIVKQWYCVQRYLEVSAGGAINIV